MFTRIAMSTVPWYEIAISIGLLVASTFGFVYQRMTEGIEVKQLNEIRTGHSNLMTKKRWQTVELFRRQKTLLDTFLEKNAITKAQYDKSLGDLREKMGMHGVN